jgi:hypothetical protein
MRSLTVAPAKLTWRVASTLARRRYLGWRDEFRLAVSLPNGAFGLPVKLDAEFVGMTRLRSIHRQRTTPSTSCFGPASAIVANSAS